MRTHSAMSRYVPLYPEMKLGRSEKININHMVEETPVLMCSRLWPPCDQSLMRMMLTDEVGPERSLLVLWPAFRGKSDHPNGLFSEDDA